MASVVKQPHGEVSAPSNRQQEEKEEQEEEEGNESKGAKLKGASGGEENGSADDDDLNEDEDEDYDAAEEASGTLLGFAEALDEPLLSHHFPSKIGGRPAWLNLRDVPLAPKCPVCNSVLSFLLQESILLEHSEELARSNQFYPSEYKKLETLEVDKSRIHEPFPGIHLCYVCGVLSTQRCSRCKLFYYCSRSHQAAHWRAEHKEKCILPSSSSGAGDKAINGVENSNNNTKKQNTTAVSRRNRRKKKEAWEAMKKMMYPEFEIVIEEELQKDVDKANRKQDKYNKEKKLLEAYEREKALLSEQDRSKEDEAFRTDKNLNRAFRGVDSRRIRKEMIKEAIAEGDRKDSRDNDTSPDHIFERFQEIVRANPDQVVRYVSRRNLEEGSVMKRSPLWISTKGRPAQNEVPKCQRCGAEREFEFQIMPQTLNYLDLDPMEKDSLDWGVIVIFTCPNSCGNGEEAYFEEHAQCQMILESP